MPDRAKNFDHSREEPQDKFNVESFLNELYKVSEIEAKFFVNTKEVKLSDPKFTPELLEDLRAFHELELAELLNSDANSSRQIRIKTDRARQRGDAVIFRSEVSEFSDAGRAHVIPVNINRRANGEEKARREVFNAGVVGYMTSFSYISGSEEKSSLTGLAAPQLDSNAFLEALSHLKMHFGPQPRNVPSCLRDLVNRVAETVTTTYLRGHLESEFKLSGTMLEDAYQVELEQLARRHNIPEIVEGKILAEGKEGGKAYASVQIEVAFSVAFPGTPLQSRILASISADLYLDELGIPSSSITGFDDIRFEETPPPSDAKRKRRAKN